MFGVSHGVGTVWHSLLSAHQIGYDSKTVDRCLGKTPMRWCSDPWIAISGFSFVEDSMPNHVSNKITFRSLIGDDTEEATAMEQLMALMKTDEHPFDFNVLIPYPARFAEPDSARAKEEAAGVKWSDLPMDGYNRGGYEWCCEHWGTKWNAYDISADSESIMFCTAWRTPWPIWAAIAERFPSLEFVVEWADEDRGRNCGIAIYLDGKQISRVQDDGLADPGLFADAIVYEQRAAHYYNKLDKARERIKELETALRAATDAPPPTSAPGGERSE